MIMTVESAKSFLFESITAAYMFAFLIVYYKPRPDHWLMIYCIWYWFMGNCKS